MESKLDLLKTYINLWEGLAMAFPGVADRILGLAAKKTDFDGLEPVRIRMHKDLA
jgi:hypothetical protein